MQAQEMVHAFLTLNIYIAICLPTALTVTGLRSYEMFERLLIVRMNKRVGIRGIIHFPMLGDVFPYQRGKWIPFE
jgi:hypothetical protein